jgi:hypothetical protein
MKEITKEIILDKTKDFLETIADEIAEYGFYTKL